MALVKKKIIPKTRFVIVHLDRELSEVARKKCERHENASRHAHATIGRHWVD